MKERTMGFYKYSSGIGSVALSLHAVTSSAYSPPSGILVGPLSPLATSFHNNHHARPVLHMSTWNTMHYVAVTPVTNASFTSKS